MADALLVAAPSLIDTDFTERRPIRDMSKARRPIFLEISGFGGAKDDPKASMFRGRGFVAAPLRGEVSFQSASGLAHSRTLARRVRCFSSANSAAPRASKEP